MLLANTAVAQHIAVYLPEQALLRRHDVPLERRIVCRITSIHFLTELWIENICRTCPEAWIQYRCLIIWRRDALA